MSQGECDPCGVDIFGVRFPGALPPAIHIHPLRGCFSLPLYIICENGLVYFEPYQDVRAAIRREKQIKGWLRAKNIALIEELNPTWDDLAAGWFPVTRPDRKGKAGPSSRHAGTQDDSFLGSRTPRRRRSSGSTHSLHGTASVRARTLPTSPPGQGLRSGSAVQSRGYAASASCATSCFPLPGRGGRILIASSRLALPFFTRISAQKSIT